jgi:hypothetical protein
MPDSEQVCRELLKREILVDWRPKAVVRMSPHFYNRDDELELVITSRGNLERACSRAQIDSFTSADLLWALDLHYQGKRAGAFSCAVALAGPAMLQKP